MSENGVKVLRERLGQVHDLHAAINVLQWDMEVNMPPKAGPGRGHHIATLSALAHRLFTEEAVGAMLNAIDTSNGLTEDERHLLRETRYDYEQQRRVPEEFVQAFAEEQSRAYEAWVEARNTSDYNLFRPHLERLVEMLRRRADFLGYEGSPYNALLNEYERGMTVEQLDDLFGGLAKQQSTLVARIVESGRQPDTAWLDREWDVDGQWAFTLRVLDEIGYDFAAGRQDRSIHPFTTTFDLFDVRVTTRLDSRDLFSSLTSSLHEGGHALYEQGFRIEDQRSPLAHAPSLGIHESQSRMWENLIGRSLPFWRHYTHRLREYFPEALKDVTPEMMHAAINVVRPSFIRVEADECTYNLHIILRYELERALIEGNLKVSELPDAWNEKVQRYLSLDVPDDAEGCLQDIHWSHGDMGYFPTYALGNLYASQLFDKIVEDVPDLWTHVEQGHFDPLVAWLREHVHVHGRRKLTTQIVEDATGMAPTPEPYLTYLTTKYEGLYGLS